MRAPAITPGGAPVTVTTTIPGQNAKLTFAGTAGRRVSLKVSGVTIGTSTTGSLKVSITKPDGTALVAATSMGTNGGYIDVKSLPTTGTYTILVDPQELCDRLGHAAALRRPRRCERRDHRRGSTRHGHDHDSGPEREAHLRGHGRAAHQPECRAGCCSIKVSITKPDGTALVAATSMGTSGGYIDVKSLPTTGTYTILVDPQLAAIGSATLQLYDVPADATPRSPPGERRSRSRPRFRARTRSSPSRARPGGASA